MNLQPFSFPLNNNKQHPFIDTRNMNKNLNSTKTFHFFITGIIRPNINYLNFLSSKIKNLFNNYNIKLYLLTWDNQNINSESISNFDYIFFEPEPSNQYIFSNITNRTKQEKHLNKRNEISTINTYKQFFAIRKIIDNILTNNIYISDNDIVIRIRPDLYFIEYNSHIMNIILNNFCENILYFCPRYETALSSCDWFGISTFLIFKKILYIENDNLYNNLIQNIWNPEDIIIFNSKKHNIKCSSLNNIIKLRLCREFLSTESIRIQEYK